MYIYIELLNVVIATCIWILSSEAPGFHMPLHLLRPLQFNQKPRMIRIHRRMLLRPHKPQIVRKSNMLYPRIPFPHKPIRHALLHVQTPPFIILQIQIAPHHRIPHRPTQPLEIRQRIPHQDITLRERHSPRSRKVARASK
jgi:hypothetical protein